MILTEPLRVTDTTEVYDVDATIDGGGVTGQAGALRLGIARALIELDPELRPELKRAGFLTRDASREGVQEVRPQEGPQGSAVLQALIRRRAAGAPAQLRAVRVPSRGGARRRSAAMSLRFGTDGVRGSADASSPPSWSPPSGGPRRGCSAVARLRDRPRHPRVGRRARGGARRRPGRRGRARRRPRASCRRRRSPGCAAADGVPGAVISASHNPFADNGIKFFAAGGRKLSDEVEEQLEAELDAPPRPRARPAAPGRPTVPAAPGAGRSAGGLDAGRSRRSTGAGSTGCASWSTAPTAPPRRSPPTCCGASAPRSRCSTTRPTAATSTTAAARPTPRTSQRAVVERGRRRRPRLRRRRRPRAGGRRAGRAGRRRPDHRASAPSTCSDRGRAAPTTRSWSP